MKSEAVCKDVPGVFELTHELIRQYGPRIPGSDACIKTARRLREEFQKVCDRAYLQEYVQFPGAFYNINKILVFTYLAASVLYLFHGRLFYASAILYALGVFYFVIQFILLGTLFDRLFKKAPGCNVVGIVEPRRAVRQQIILSGHHDSTYICNFMEKNQKWYSFRLIAPILFFIYALAASVISSAFEIAGSPPAGFVAGSTFVICGGLLFVVPLYFFHNKEGTPGAGDNLLSSVLCSKLPEILEKTNGPLQNTRLVLLSTDGEEIGQKGARSFIEHFRTEMNRIKTYVFNFDSIYRTKDLAFLKSEVNGTVHLSKSLLHELEILARQSGFLIQTKNLPVGGGGTDAGQFAKIGIDTVSLIGLSTSLIRKDLHYHTSRDLIENIEPEAVAAALRIAMGFILKKDSEVRA